MPIFRLDDGSLQAGKRFCKTLRVLLTHPTVPHLTRFVLNEDDVAPMTFLNQGAVS